jgi:hypothetical protein
MKISSIILSATLIILVLGSCSVQKRHYRSGYHLVWLQKKSSDKPQPDYSGADTSKDIKAAIYNEKETTATVDKNSALDLSLQNTRISLLPPDTCNDQMLMKNGDRITAKVTEITEEHIKYKRCDNLSGPSYTVGREKVHSITYSNGVKEIIEPPALKKGIKAQDVATEKKKYPNQLKWAAFLTFTPYINYIGILIGLFLTLKARRKILSQPTLYRGIHLADYILLFDAMVALMIIGIIIMITYFWTSSLALLGIAFVIAALIGMVGGAFYYAFK